MNVIVPAITVDDEPVASRIGIFDNLESTDDTRLDHCVGAPMVWSEDVSENGKVCHVVANNADRCSERGVLPPNVRERVSDDRVELLAFGCEPNSVSANPTERVV